MLAEQSSQPQNSEQQNIVGRAIYLAEHEEGCSQAECLRIAQGSEESLKELIHGHWDWNDHNVDVLVQTRAQAALDKAELDDIGEDAPDTIQEHSPNNQNDKVFLQ